MIGVWETFWRSSASFARGSSPSPPDARGAPQHPADAVEGAGGRDRFALRSGMVKHSELLMDLEEDPYSRTIVLGLLAEMQRP
jgi:hypothetical protein